MRKIIKLIFIILIIVGCVFLYREKPTTKRLNLDTLKAVVFGAIKKLPLIAKDKEDTSVPTPLIKKVIWCENQCFWINNEGKILGESPETEGGLLMVIKASPKRDIKSDSELLSSTEIQNLFSILDILKNIDLKPEPLQLDLAKEEVIVTANSGQKIYFSLRFSPEFGLPVIQSLRKSGEWNSVNYLDLRVENRAYYK